jgi:hypothetical protein
MTIRCLPLIVLVMTGSWSGQRAGAETGARLPFQITPAATGEQLVRLSLPFSPGMLSEGQGLVVSDGQHENPAAVRVLTWHPAVDMKTRSARRVLVTFPYRFADRKPVSFRVRATPTAPRGERLPVKVRVDGSGVTIAYRDGPTLTAHLLAPARQSDDPPATEIVESNAFFHWQRVQLPDKQWPRVIEVRVDALGGVALVAHLQRNLPGDGYAPDLGWEIVTSVPPGSIRLGNRAAATASLPLRHPFTTREASECFFEQDRYCLYHPAAPFRQRGYIDVRRANGRGFVYQYLRCTAADKVPMQAASWRRAEVVIAPAALAPLTATLEYPHAEQIDWRLWDALYATCPPPDLTTQPDLAALLRYHHDAIARAAAQGDDWGNVTAYSDGSDVGTPFGMNRLNHCPAIFEEAWRSGDRRLRDVAVNWCNNFYDLSVWWGPERTGGTRYNNVRAMKRTPLDNDLHFMWRSNSSVDFCTKGYSAFLLAYEQTGDPRMRQALEAQVNYASHQVHADRGEARNIGDVDDFMRLYHCTGEPRYREQALRLYRELRTKLSAGDLFSQSGQPIVAKPPFINDDEEGYHHPFAKPYIIGYALQGLPRLAPLVDREPKLRAVIRAVADFLADSQDSLGGWRYPHPRSSSVLLQQAMEHAAQIVEADRYLGATPKHLDAIERVLRQRILGWKKTGRILSGLSGWEFTAGKATKSSDLANLYAHPADRDFRRDYREGQITWGSSSPEGVIFFPAVLAFYLEHRPASRLLALPRADEPLGQVLARVNGGSK